MACVAAVLGAIAIIAVHRVTGGYFPFLSGFALVTVVAGGFGPTNVAALGSLVMVHFVPPVGLLVLTERTDVARLAGNVVLLVVASVLAGLFRRSRLATLEREARLERAAAGVRALLDESSEAIVLTDRAPRVTYANKRADVVFGFAPGAIIGRTVESIIRPESPGRLPINLEALDAGRGRYLTRESTSA